MKLKRTPLILLAIAALLGAGVYFHEIQSAPQRQESQEKAKRIYPFEEKDIKAFTLRTPQQTLAAVAKPTTGNSGTSSATPSTWQLTEPQQGSANDASVAYLLNLIATAQTPETLKIPANRQAEFGLDKPLATIDVTLADNKSHRLILGKPDINRTYLYAQVDPPTPAGTELSIVLLPLEFENAVKRPLSEWQAVVKPPVPTPSPKQSPKKPSK
jgi:hypothetical protein